MRATAAVLLAAFLLSGCYTYVPTGMTLPAQGKPVRVFLSTPQDVRLSDLTANDVVVIDGELIGTSDEQVALSAWWVKSRSGYETLGQGETVTIPLSHLEGVRQKRLSVLRTAAVTGLAFLVSTVTIAYVARGGGEPGPGDNGGRSD